MMDALGFSKNRQPFQKLSRVVSYKQLMSAIRNDKDETALMRLQAILLGASGLLTGVASRTNDLTAVPFVQRLENLWYEFRSAANIVPIKKSEWKLFRLRPANFPTLRIAGFAKFLINHRPAKLINLFLKPAINEPDPHRLVSHWQSFLTVLSFGYWSDHFYWGDDGRHEHHDLIGAQRAFEIIVNGILPVLALYAEQKKKPDLSDKMNSVYRDVPSQEKNSVIRFMASQGLRPGTAVKKPAIQFIQGLIHLHKRCIENNCAECAIFEKAVIQKFTHSS
jgi:hypothetical protein